MLDISTREALRFAQELADAELARIERMHQRTLTLIGLTLAIIGAFLGIFGYIGYTNLRDAAIATATKNMQKSVDSSVASGLSNLDIHGALQRGVDDYTRTTLRTQVAEAVKHGSLHDDLVATGRSETLKLLKASAVQRAPTLVQRQMIIARISLQQELNGSPVCLYRADGSTETLNYFFELEQILSSSRLKVVSSCVGPNEPVDTGITVFCAMGSACAHAKALNGVLSEVGLQSRQKMVVFPRSDGDPGQDPTVVAVGPAFPR